MGGDEGGVGGQQVFKGVVTEVLVSQIEQGTVASRDGRLRIGDQILQVRLCYCVVVVMCCVAVWWLEVIYRRCCGFESIQRHRTKS